MKDQVYSLKPDKLMANGIIDIFIIAPQWLGIYNFKL